MSSSHSPFVSIAPDLLATATGGSSTKTKEQQPEKKMDGITGRLQRCEKVDSQPKTKEGKKSDAAKKNWDAFHNAMGLASTVVSRGK